MLQLFVCVYVSYDCPNGLNEIMFLHVVVVLWNVNISNVIGRDFFL